MKGLFSQGDFVLVDFDPTVGHEPKKRRPALVVSTDRFNSLLSSLAVVCPITSVDNGYPLHIEIAPGNATEGFICTEQLRAVDLKHRKAARMEGGTLDEETMGSVLTVMGAIFGI